MPRPRRRGERAPCVLILLLLASAYVDSSMLGSGQIARGAILGQKGGVWATSAGYTVSPFAFTQFSIAVRVPAGFIAVS